MSIQLVGKDDPKQFKETSSYVVAFVGSAGYKLCSGVVNKQYIQKTGVRAATHILTVEKPSVKTRSKAASRNLGGFALLRKHNNYIYIDVICGRGHGKDIISYIELLAKAWKLRFIVLSALPPPIPTYRKWGFIFGEKVCNEDNTIANRPSSFS